MHTLLRLPLALLELALRDGLSLARSLLRLVGPSDGSPPPSPPGPAARPDPAAPPPVRADAAMQRTRSRERERARATAPAAVPAPEAERLGEVPPQVSREAELVASFGPSGEDGHAAVGVMMPWKGYEVQPAAEIVARVRKADEATKAVVLLYEQGHKSRATVLRAARA